MHTLMFHFMRAQQKVSVAMPSTWNAASSSARTPSQKEDPFMLGIAPSQAQVRFSAQSQTPQPQSLFAGLQTAPSPNKKIIKASKQSQSIKSKKIPAPSPAPAGDDPFAGLFGETSSNSQNTNSAEQGNSSPVRKYHVDQFRVTFFHPLNFENRILTWAWEITRARI